MDESLKVSALLTLDLYHRDVIHSLLEKKVESHLDFQWLAHLRYYWDQVSVVSGIVYHQDLYLLVSLTSSLSFSSLSILPKTQRELQLGLCDYAASYSFEYLGDACPRLIITPLTERCYITMTTGQLPYIYVPFPWPSSLYALTSLLYLPSPSHTPWRPRTHSSSFDDRRCSDGSNGNRQN